MMRDLRMSEDAARRLRWHVVRDGRLLGASGDRERAERMAAIIGGGAEVVARPERRGTWPRGGRDARAS